MPGGDGVLALPSGRFVRGRGLRGPDPDGPDPDFALYVLASEPFGVPWEFRWCMGGRGRTGTALACLAVLDGVPAEQAVEYVRQNYHPDAIETAEQSQFVAAFA
jgi:hypothetical protein